MRSSALSLAAAAFLVSGAPTFASPVATSQLLASPLEADSATSPLSAAPWNCSIQAWVRAPDLRPNVVLPGDARLVANGTDCADIVEWSVGLRLRERGVVKLRASDVEVPTAPVYNETEEDDWRRRARQNRTQEGIFDAGEPFWARSMYMQSPYHLANQVYRQAMSNRSLWEAHAAERTAFRVQTRLWQQEGNEQVPLRSVKPFRIVVPNVNFPPSVEPDLYYSTCTGCAVEDYVNAERDFGFYVMVILKNVSLSFRGAFEVKELKEPLRSQSSTIEYPAGRVAFLPQLDMPERDGEEIIKLSMNPPDEAEQGTFRRRGDKSICAVDNSTAFEVEVKLPGRNRSFKTVTIKRTSGTQQPTEISLHALSSPSFTWAASFAHSAEQARELSRDRSSRYDYYSPLVYEESKPLNSTLEDEAKEQIRAQKEIDEGRHCHAFLSGEPQVTKLQQEVEEQTVLVNLTIPEHLYPTFNATFSSILSHLRILLKTAAPFNATGAAEYPLLSDEDDDEAWSEDPRSHIRALARSLDTGRPAVDEICVLRYRANTSITIFPRAAPPSSPYPSLDFGPPVSYLSPRARTPLLMHGNSLDLTNLYSSSDDPDIFLLDQTLVPEREGNDSDLVKTKYSNRNRWDRGEKQGGARNLAGKVWERKVAREREYEARKAALAAGDKPLLVVQAV
ncbi:hypothetical protein JCM8097_002894 [Rhodosporidiobolus ruineniae]